jgi:prevent-host-death family protein
MRTVASRELRNNTRALLDYVATGEQVVITVDGRPTAVLRSIDDRPRWVSREWFVHRILSHPADAELGDELRELVGEMTAETEL